MKSLGFEKTAGKFSFFSSSVRCFFVRFVPLQWQIKFDQSTVGWLQCIQIDENAIKLDYLISAILSIDWYSLFGFDGKMSTWIYYFQISDNFNWQKYRWIEQMKRIEHKWIPSFWLHMQSMRAMTGHEMQFPFCFRGFVQYFDNVNIDEFEIINLISIQLRSSHLPWKCHWVLMARSWFWKLAKRSKW